MTDAIKPTDAIQLIRILGTLDWRPLTGSDYCTFADAGPEARIADVNAVQHGIICETLDFRAPADMGMMALIGGDALQIELHSVDDQGSPIWVTIPLTFQFD